MLLALLGQRVLMGAVVGSAPGIGGRDGMHSGMEGIGTMDLVELGLFIHALSLKPDGTARFDLAGTCTSKVAVVVVVTTFSTVVEVAMSGIVECAICSEAIEMALRSACVAYGKVY